MNRLKFLCACLSLVGLAVIIAGCSGGISGIVPLSAKIQNADLKLAEAEQVQIKGDTKEEKAEYITKKKDLYDDALRRYLEVIDADPQGKYAQRAHFQVAEVYKRRYEWDSSVEHFDAIVELSPTGYYASRAKSGIADIRKNRRIIQEKRRIYQNRRLLEDDESQTLAAQALYDVAKAYETIGNYPAAVENYEKLITEFPAYKLTPQVQFQIGNIYFYRLHDYSNSGGWGAFVKVIEDYPESFEAREAETLLKKSSRTLTQIAQEMELIDSYKNKKAFDYLATGRYVPSTELWKMGYSDHAVQAYQEIARGWEKLRNFTYAIAAYDKLVEYISHRKFAVADALFQTGVLYQKNGELERAIDAYTRLFDKAPESTWRAEAVYNQAVCFQSIREFNEAYRGFKAYMSLGDDGKYYREAEQRVRQFELDQDGDGYKFYKEQEAGTSDQDANDYPGAQQNVGSGM